MLRLSRDRFEYLYSFRYKSLFRDPQQKHRKEGKMGKHASDEMDVILEATQRICIVNQIRDNEGFIMVRDELMDALEKGEICFQDFKQDPIPFNPNHQE